MVVGIPEFDRFSFAADLARRKEVGLQHVRRQNGCAEKTVDLVAAGRLRPSFLTTHRFDLRDTQAAFDLVDGYADGVIKAMVRIP
jgi:threonine dehydrogenase-like Zn-dependent dehydrogenase